MRDLHQSAAKREVRVPVFRVMTASPVWFGSCPSSPSHLGFRGGRFDLAEVIAKSASMSPTPSVPSAFFPVSACDLHDAGETAGIEIIAAIAHEVS
jgi:hypothetical protein